jgi:hypothetical protein
MPCKTEQNRAAAIQVARELEFFEISGHYGDACFAPHCTPNRAMGDTGCLIY